MKEILFNPLAEQHDALKERFVDACRSVIESGWFILGSEVAAFEVDFKRIVGLSEATAVASGTDALSLSLKGLGVGQNDEVIAPAFTAFPTVAAIRRVGAVPQLVDVRRPTRCLDPEKLQGALTEKTKAIVYVHLYGLPSHDIFEVKKFCEKNNLFLIEDCAQCTLAKVKGVPVGSIGDASAFSFYPTKNLGALGDGGLVASSNREVIEKVKELKQYGYRQGLSESWGWNSRMDDIQAAFLRIKLKHLEEWNQNRLELFQRYQKGLSHIKEIHLPQLEEGVEPSIHLYAVETGKRDELKKYLLENKIHTMIHYSRAIHQHPVWEEKILRPQSERLANTVLSLPFHQSLSTEGQDYIVRIVGKFFS